jgi:6-phosphogluconate dehydrogenase
VQEKNIMENKKMTIGYIGLGKMGFAMVERLLEKGYTVVANNRSNELVDRAVDVGAIGAYEISEMIEKIDAENLQAGFGDSENPAPRTIWIMVSHQAVDSVLEQLLPLLNEGDTVIDGGNSPYTETVRRAREITERGIRFMDVGTSGGPSGARNGACMMIGGDRSDFDIFNELFKDLSVENGYGYMGLNGAGHFVKMVHNGIEYGMMQAIGEGFEVMKKAEEFKLDLPEIARVYNNGSVIESSLIGWLVSGYKKHGPELDGISGKVSHSGEGQWTVEAAERLNVPVENIKQSLEFRIKSQENPSYTGQVVSVLRNEFGGHDVEEK